MGKRKPGFHVLHKEHLTQTRVAVGKHGPPRVPREGVEAVQQGAAAGMVKLAARNAPRAPGPVWEGDPPR